MFGPLCVALFCLISPRPSLWFKVVECIYFQIRTIRSLYRLARISLTIFFNSRPLAPDSSLILERENRFCPHVNSELNTSRLRWKGHLIGQKAPGLMYVGGQEGGMVHAWVGHPFIDKSLVKT